MPDNPFDPKYDQLPDVIPVFPLEGVLLLPRGHLPLNIFEPHYITMIQDVMRTHRMIGMVQPTAANGRNLFNTGCAGRIVQFQETEDGRYLLTLRGISRFEITEELDSIRGYRQVSADWTKFRMDFDRIRDLGVNRPRLLELLEAFFRINEMSIDWELVTSVNDEKLMTCLAMICPFSAGEKQALLEAPTYASRASLFIKLLEMTIGSQPLSSKH